MFVAPNWYEGLLINVVMYLVVPLIIAIIFIGVRKAVNKKKVGFLAFFLFL